MRGQRFFILFFCWLVLTARAFALEVAFFIKRNPLGQIEVMEEGSLYSHVAMRVGDQWLNAHPYYGIQLTANLDGMGEMVEILSDPHVPEPGDDFLAKVVGKNFFIFADWNDDELYYCSKLVGKYLGLDPQPMVIDPVLWQGRFQEYNGRPGLSPGELHAELKSLQYQVRSIARGCRSRLRR